MQRPPTVTTEIKRGRIQVFDLAGEMHQTAIIIAVQQIQKVPRFMQSDFGDPFQDLLCRRRFTVNRQLQTVERDQGHTAVLAGLTEHMGKKGNEQILFDQGDDLEVVGKIHGLDTLDERAGIDLQATHVKRMLRNRCARQCFGGQIQIPGHMGGDDLGNGLGRISHGKYANDRWHKMGLHDVSCRRLLGKAAGH